MDTVQSIFTHSCRTCRSENGNLRSMFEVYQILTMSPRIDEMLMACTSIQVKEEDGLSTMICSNCMEQLHNAYLFKQQCLESETNLRECAKINSVENQQVQQNKENSVKEESPYIIDSIDKLLQESTNNIICEEIQIIKASGNSDFIDLIENNQIVLTCRECGKVFTTIDGLRSHKRIHSGTLFKCKYCNKGYTRQSHVYRHELSHARHKLHVCRICNKTLSRKEHLKRHLTTHLKEKPLACKSCNRGFNRADHLELHLLRCKGDRVHICDICNRGFIREDSLIVHKKLHENQKPVLPTLESVDDFEQFYYEIDHDSKIDFDTLSDVEDDFESQNNHAEYDDDIDQLEGNDASHEIQIDNFKSPMHNYENELNTNETYDNCIENGDDQLDETLSEYLPSKSHQKIKRGRGRPRKHPLSSKNGRRPRGRPPAVKKEETENMTVDKEEIGDFSCSICNKTFIKYSLLEKHCKQHEIHSCKICYKQFNRLNHLKRHMTSHAELRPYTCDQCNKTFVRRDHLNQHVRLHDQKQEYECDICFKSFYRSDLLDKHKSIKHNVGDKVIGEKKYECHLCLKSFTTEKYRDVHVKAHMGEKKFKCKTCDKCFVSKSHLTEHMKFHNEHSKKFLCSECGQRFIRNDYLVIHMRRHRGEKPFKCKYCGKGFPRTTDLTVHERYHTGEKTHLCTICGRGFGRAYNLTVHMRTHTGEKPYQCTYCDAAFAQGNDLKAHVRRHTGERFHCELCSESFLMGYLLTQHKRTVHGLNVVSNIRRLQPVTKIKEDIDDPPPITIPLPKPIVPDILMHNIQHIQAQMNVQLPPQ